MSALTSARTPKETLSLLGLWSAVGIAVLLFWSTLIGGVSYGNLIQGIGNLVSGYVSFIPNGSEDSLATASMNIVAVVLMTLATALIAGALFSRGAKSYEIEKLDALLDKGALYVFAIILIEELFTRGLFLGLGTMLFKGDFAFYVLFIGGNAIWAWTHLANFSDKSERSILRVVPQFVGGIGFTYIFVRYGLGAAIMAHYLYDAILFATRKEIMPNGVTWFTLIYYAVLALILFFVNNASGIGLANVVPWINNDLKPLDSFSFIQYATLLVMIDSIVSVTANVLLLDTSAVKRDTAEKMSNVVVLLLTGLLYTVIVLGGNLLLSLIVHDVATRAVVLTIILALMSPTTSGSMLARSTLVGLPSTFFTVAAFSVLGFMPAFGLSLVFIAAGYIPLYINSD